MLHDLVLAQLAERGQRRPEAVRVNPDLELVDERLLRQHGQLVERDLGMHERRGRV